MAWALACLPQAALGSAPLLAPLPAEFQRFQQQQALRLQQPDLAGHAPGWVPLPVDLSHLTAVRLPLLGLPGSYDLRAHGKMPPIRNQGQCGACWTFATCAAVESLIWPADPQDFSENHMKNTHGYDVGPCAGGNYLMSAAYFARWGGPVAETADPYNEFSTTSPPGLPAIREVREMILFPNRSGPLDNDLLKNAILTYGAVATAIRWEDGSYNPTTHAYRYAGSGESNHGVALVGWDDGFPAWAFPNPPPGNGAFLVRNSWGPEFGDAGYFHLSYYDSRIETSAVFPEVYPAGSFLAVLGHDPLGATGTTGYPGSTTGWMASVFSAPYDMRIGAVGFYTWEMDTAFEVLVHDQVSGAPRSGTLVGQARGSLHWPGFHTVPLSLPATVTGGRSFSVVVKIQGVMLETVLTVEGPVGGYSSAARARPGQSFLAPDGVQWTDLTTVFPNHDVCLKAYALPECIQDRDCDDQVPCTRDQCLGGRCTRALQAGWCRIEGTCIPDGTRNGACLFCDVNRQPTAWTYSTGQACDDGNPCTSRDVCRPGGASNADCQGTPYSCEDGLACTEARCLGDGGCSHGVREDQCLVGGLCVMAGVSGGPCLECRPWVAQDRWTYLEGQSCDDGNVCTAGDRCLPNGLGDQACRGVPVTCDDGNPCTDDSCDTASGCRFTPNTAPCDDANACTDSDRCQAGRCVGTSVTCDDANPCTDDSCDAASGCRFTPNTAPCDDEDPCTVTQCSGGTCRQVSWQPGCCHRLEDCGDPAWDCDGERSVCREVSCRLCTRDEECGAPGNRCVAMTSGSHCLVGCDPRGPVCPPETRCDPSEATTGICVPIRGDCLCVERVRRACIEGTVRWLDSCGEPGEVWQHCEGRGCSVDHCCAQGTHEQAGVCVPDPSEEVPEAGQDLPGPLQDTGSAAETSDPEEGDLGIEEGPFPEEPNDAGPGEVPQETDRGSAGESLEEVVLQRDGWAPDTPEGPGADMAEEPWDPGAHGAGSGRSCAASASPSRAWETLLGLLIGAVPLLGSRLARYRRRTAQNSHRG